MIIAACGTHPRQRVGIVYVQPGAAAVVFDSQFPVLHDHQIRYRSLRGGEFSDHLSIGHGREFHPSFERHHLWPAGLICEEILQIAFLIGLAGIGVITWGWQL